MSESGESVQDVEAGRETPEPPHERSMMAQETNTAVAEWTPDERLINGAAQELQLMLETSPWHPSECLRRVFVSVLEKVRAGVKAACPEIPPAPAGDFRAELEGGKGSLDIDITDEGGAEIDIYNREDRAVAHLSAEDFARLRAWLR